MTLFNQSLSDPISPSSIRLPDDENDRSQDKEWCEVRIDGRWKRIRFHDYDTIYSIPGLYETLFYRKLKCCSPKRVVGLLGDVLDDHPESAEDLEVLDVGAGNGIVGEELTDMGVQRVVGVDIIDEARDAAMRDRPDVYDEYLVTDLCDLPEEDQAKLDRRDFNCMTTVAALGFGDIPIDAFTTAFNLVDAPGWVAFNIKEDFLDEADDDTGFCRLIRAMTRDKIIRVESYRRYRHRLAADGSPLHYVAMVASKQDHIPERYTV